jgi:CheY-like chemotaxis protein
MKKIFVADDDAAILDVICIILEEEGYEVFAVSEGSIIDLVTETQPDLLLLDIWMSGVDGGEIAKKLKEMPTTKDIPILLISANRDTERIAGLSGADGFISKPFDIDEFAAVVKKWVS